MKGIAGYHDVGRRDARYRPRCDMSYLWDLLESSGPIALNELSLRASESPEELVRRLDEWKKDGTIVVRGPKAETLLKLTPEEISQSSDTVVELSRSSLRRSLA